MPRKKYTPEQIIQKLREAEIRLNQGEVLEKVCRSLAISKGGYSRPTGPTRFLRVVHKCGYTRGRSGKYNLLILFDVMARSENPSLSLRQTLSKVLKYTDTTSFAPSSSAHCRPPYLSKEFNNSMSVCQKVPKAQL
jgi:hypothetical protein